MVSVIPAKVFSLEEAQRILPQIKQSFRVLFETKEVLASFEEDIELLFQIWGDGVLDIKNSDHQLYRQTLRKKEMGMMRAKAVLDYITAAGVIIKDASTGLVDFYAEVGGEQVFLCWRYGEEAITHWHALSEGFDGRKSLSTLRA